VSALARRFPASQGYRTRADIPTITDLTSAALAAHGRGDLTDRELARMLHDFLVYRDPGHWWNATARGRALNMADVMGHSADLVHMEARLRAEGIAP